METYSKGIFLSGVILLLAGNLQYHDDEKEEKFYSEALNVNLCLSPAKRCILEEWLRKIPVRDKPEETFEDISANMLDKEFQMDAVLQNSSDEINFTSFLLDEEPFIRSRLRPKYGGKHSDSYQKVTTEQNAKPTSEAFTSSDSDSNKNALQWSTMLSESPTLKLNFHSKICDKNLSHIDYPSFENISSILFKDNSVPMTLLPRQITINPINTIHSVAPPTSNALLSHWFIQSALFGDNQDIPAFSEDNLLTTSEIIATVNENLPTPSLNNSLILFPQTSPLSKNMDGSLVFVLSSSQSERTSTVSILNGNINPLSSVASSAEETSSPTGTTTVAYESDVWDYTNSPTASFRESDSDKDSTERSDFVDSSDIPSSSNEGPSPWFSEFGPSQQVTASRSNDEIRGTFSNLLESIPEYHDSEDINDSYNDEEEVNTESNGMLHISSSYMGSSSPSFQDCEITSSSSFQHLYNYYRYDDSNDI